MPNPTQGRKRNPINTVNQFWDRRIHFWDHLSYISSLLHFNQFWDRGIQSTLVIGRSIIIGWNINWEKLKDGWFLSRENHGLFREFPNRDGKWMVSLEHFSIFNMPNDIENVNNRYHNDLLNTRTLTMVTKLS